jgi:predicted methyltransferase
MIRRMIRRHGRAALVGFMLLTALVGGACARRRLDPNDPYRDPHVSADDWNRLFEAEQRQIFVERAQIMRLAHVQPGTRVADVGAGTGLFSMLLSDAVGGAGVVYAEDVMEKFSAFVAARAVREGRTNVVSVVGTEASLGLPPGSIDLAFLVDVYHHFDHPREMLASVRRALRPNGQLFLVDYRREVGQSPTWLLEHVRAGEATVVDEVEAAGFTLFFRDETLRDSYALRFRRDTSP